MHFVQFEALFIQSAAVCSIARIKFNSPPSLLPSVIYSLQLALFVSSGDLEIPQRNPRPEDLFSLFSFFLQCEFYATDYLYKKYTNILRLQNVYKWSF